MDSSTGIRDILIVNSKGYTEKNNVKSDDLLKAQYTFHDNANKLIESNYNCRRGDFDRLRRLCLLIGSEIVGRN